MWQGDYGTLQTNPGQAGVLPRMLSAAAHRSLGLIATAKSSTTYSALPRSVFSCRLERLLKKSEIPTPRGLKSARRRKQDLCGTAKAGPFQNANRSVSFRSLLRH